MRLARAGRQPRWREAGAPGPPAAASDRAPGPGPPVGRSGFAARPAARRPGLPPRAVHVSGPRAGKQRDRNTSPRTSPLECAPMLLFQKRFHAGLVSGAVTVTFRRWKKPHVRPGGRYRCHPIGVLEVDRVGRVRPGAVTDEDARRAGFESRAELFSYIATGPEGPPSADEELWRIELHYGGDGDRVEVALDDHLTADQVAALARRLRRMGDWTVPTLRLIGRRPRVAASKLAASLGPEPDPFKLHVRPL